MPNTLQHTSKQIHQQLHTIAFYYPKDKEQIIQYIDYLIQDCTPGECEALHYFLLQCLKDYQHHTMATMQPLALLDALIHHDVRGKKISHEEFFSLYRDLLGFEEHRENVTEIHERIEQTYAITVMPVHTDYEQNNIRIQALDTARFVSCVPRIYQCIAVYPPVFIQRSRLDRIVVAGALTPRTKAGSRIPTHIGGFATNNDHHIYLRFGDIQRSFDHELYHQAMHHYHDTYRRAQLRRVRDYFVQYRKPFAHTHGFAVQYGRENIAEDQATMAEYMMREYDNMQHRAQHDTTLRKKMQLVHDACQELSDGAMNTQWFSTLSKRRTQLLHSCLG